jgi:hypothetical protein
LAWAVAARGGARAAARMREFTTFFFFRTFSGVRASQGRVRRDGLRRRALGVPERTRCADTLGWRGGAAHHAHDTKSSPLPRAQSISMGASLAAGTTDALAAALPAEEGASLLHVLPLLAANDAALRTIGARSTPQPSAFADARVPRASVAALVRADAASDGARGAALLACVCHDARAFAFADDAVSPLQREVAMQRARAVKAVVAALTRALAMAQPLDRSWEIWMYGVPDIFDKLCAWEPSVTDSTWAAQQLRKTMTFELDDWLLALKKQHYRLTNLRLEPALRTPAFTKLADTGCAIMASSYGMYTSRGQPAPYMDDD